MPRDTSIHPDLRRIAMFVPRTTATPTTWRLWRMIDSLPPLVRVKDVEALTLPTGMGVRLYRPPENGEPSPGLLWIHAGGFLYGKAQHEDPLCHRFSRKLGITVAAPEYRLAPQHPYPAAREDCYAALKWLASLPGVDADRVAIGGESSGGGLAAALALLARDRGEIRPVLQVLSYPMLDDRTVSDGDLQRSYRMWNARSNRFAWASYLSGADPNVAVPARHTDLSGLPPAWIGIGTADLFYDEDLAYAERLKNAGVPCHVEVVPGAFHAFDRIAPGKPVSQAFFDSQCASLRAALKV